MYEGGKGANGNFSTVLTLQREKSHDDRMFGVKRCVNFCRTDGDTLLS